MSTQVNEVNVANFDRWSKRYGGDRIAPWFLENQKSVLDALELSNDDWILDVGCGTGRAVKLAAERVREGRACGVDLSPGMVERAVAEAAQVPNAEFKVADAEQIPYADGTFDAVMCTNSFHHYSEPLKALGEMRRLLKPGGRVIIQDQDRKGCLWVRGWDLWNRTFERGHVKYYAWEEVVELLEKANFENCGLVSRVHRHFTGGKVATATFLVKGTK